MDVVNQQQELPGGTCSDEIDPCNFSTSDAFGVFHRKLNVQVDGASAVGDEKNGPTISGACSGPSTFWSLFIPPLQSCNQQPCYDIRTPTTDLGCC
jgi:hypothetical protein